MRRFRHLLACSLVFGLALLGAGCEDENADMEFFEAELSGSSEVPPRSTAASGRTGFAFDGTNLVFSLEVDDISNVLFAHIHVGAVGVNGPVRMFLFNGPTTSTTDRIVLSSGTLTAADTVGISFADLIAAMRSGNAYVNVHTTLFPGGEIRGQIRVED